MNSLFKNLLFKESNIDNFYDDTWEDIPRKPSLIHVSIDLLLSPTYRLPKTVTTIRIYSNGDGFSICPRCKNAIEYEYQSYCGSCGQYLDWSKFDKAEIIPSDFFFKQQIPVISEVSLVFSAIISFFRSKK